MTKHTKHTKRNGTGRSREQLDALDRFFHDMPVIDARGHLRLFVTQEDIAEARRRDPEHCVFANACRRLFGSSAILFFRTIAYVDLPDENNVRSVERFYMTPRTQKRIAEFDKTGVAPPGGFLLNKPSTSRTLEKSLTFSRGYRQRERGAAMAASKEKRAATLKGVAKRRMTLAATATDIRSGNGMVHFNKT